MSDSVRPQRRQPTRLPRPWDSPGKNTGVGCHFLLQCMKVKSESEVAQSCPTLRDPMDCSPPGSSIHGIFQARVLEWGAIAFSHWWATCCQIAFKRIEQSIHPLAGYEYVHFPFPHHLWESYISGNFMGKKLYQIVLLYIWLWVIWTFWYIYCPSLYFLSIFFVHFSWFIL